MNNTIHVKGTINAIRHTPTVVKCVLLAWLSIDGRRSCIATGTRLSSKKLKLVVRWQNITERLKMDIQEGIRAGVHSVHAGKTDKESRWCSNKTIQLSRDLQNASLSSILRRMQFSDGCYKTTALLVRLSRKHDQTTYPLCVSKHKFERFDYSWTQNGKMSTGTTWSFWQVYDLSHHQEAKFWRMLLSTRGSSPQPMGRCCGIWEIWKHILLDLNKRRHWVPCRDDMCGFCRS